MTRCLWEAEIKVGVYSLNLRLTSLILTTIGKLWFWWWGILTGSVFTSSGFIRNRSVLDVMSRWKCHSSHNGDDVTQDTVLVLLSDAHPIVILWPGHEYPIIETSYQTSDMCFGRGRHLSSPSPSTWLSDTGPICTIHLYTTLDTDLDILWWICPENLGRLGALLGVDLVS